ncbi:MAG TPA: cobalamin-dependent protein [Phycisphaerae bacterium]|nr:cobalamin-dependent protein [Phycisphaerae bacterium]HRY66681.1 cobalamin-dependent protein [Phycisphaerae bacterium]HSA27616.1 cobalamin-dependent protein [Phycisphaerae bacterium]
MSDSALLERLAGAIEGMDANAVKSLARDALAAGLSPATVLNEGLSLGMRRVGQKFNAGDMFMPEVLVACDVYFAGLEVVRPLLAASEGENRLGTMVLGNIHGDIHTVGKNVAIPVFEANGLRVIDVGESLDDQVFVDAIRKHKPQIVGLGTYMTSTFMHTGETVAAIAKAGLRSQVKIICGGPAVDAEAARRMGADDASDDAWKAVDKIRKLLGK